MVGRPLMTGAGRERAEEPPLPALPHSLIKTVQLVEGEHLLLGLGERLGLAVEHE